MTGGADRQPCARTGLWITPKAIARAHQLWLAGTSTAEIARQVGAPSKSALIGYSRRADWPRRHNPSKPHALKGGSVKLPEHGKRVAAVRPLALIARPPPPALTCQWVKTKGHRGQGWVFCDAPAVPGRSWCRDHLLRCYVRPRARDGSHFALTWLTRAAA
jgi:hypothetical protein